MRPKRRGSSARLRQLISLQRPSVGGSVVEALADLEQVARVHARKMPITSDETESAGRPSGVAKTLFRIRLSTSIAEINSTWRLVECVSTDVTADLLEEQPTGRLVWDIKGVDDVEERGRWLHLTCEAGGYGR